MFYQCPLEGASIGNTRLGCSRRFCLSDGCTPLLVVCCSIWRLSCCIVCCSFGQKLSQTAKVVLTNTRWLPVSMPCLDHYPTNVRRLHVDSGPSSDCGGTAL